MKNIENRTTEYILPTKIIDQQNVVDSQNLLVAKPMQIGLNEPVTTTISSGGHIILDFGRELCGGVRILTYACNDGSVRLRLGESVSESCSEIGEKGSTNDHSLRDTVTKLVNFSDMKFLESGFRFARIDNIGAGDILIKNVYAASVYRDIAYKGEFWCDDEQLNQIYNTARYTVHLNMQNMLWDGIKRDRLVWIGDTHPEMLAITCIFGADDCIQQALDFARDQAPLPQFMNGYPTYSMWWILILKDYYMQNNNMEYLQQNKDYLVDLLNIFDGLVDSDGACHLPFYFLDWASNNKPDAMGGVRGLFILAIKAAKTLMQALGKSEKTADNLLSKLQKVKYPVAVFKQAKAMQILAGQEDAVSNYEFLTSGGARGMSTFMSYYVLSSIAEGGDFAATLDIAKQYYGAMLNRGATTFWEDFDIDWLEGSGRIDELPKNNQKDLHGDYGSYCFTGFRHSLCHGWSGGIVPFLTHYVLGVKVLEPGCTKIKIAPNLAYLNNVKGKYPTPFGDVIIQHVRQNNKIVTTISAPTQVQIVQ